MARRRRRVPGKRGFNNGEGENAAGSWTDRSTEPGSIAAKELAEDRAKQEAFAEGDVNGGWFEEYEEDNEAHAKDLDDANDEKRPVISTNVALNTELVGDMADKLRDVARQTDTEVDDALVEAVAMRASGHVGQSARVTEDKLQALLQRLNEAKEKTDAENEKFLQDMEDKLSYPGRHGHF